MPDSTTVEFGWGGEVARGISCACITYIVRPALRGLTTPIGYDIRLRQSPLLKTGGELPSFSLKIGRWFDGAHHDIFLIFMRLFCLVGAFWIGRRGGVR